MVFDGEKPLGQRYSEEDTPHPLNWYAMTKYEGEKIVQQAKIPWVILRIAYPYRASFEKKEYVRVFLSRLQNNQEINAIYDHYFTPTFIDDLALVIDTVIKQNTTGIFHTVGSQVISAYDAAIIIARKFQLNDQLIKRTTREKYFAEKATRPFNLSLKGDKILQLGIKMTSFEEGIEKIKSQMTQENL
jgi:dTDP-4-dehydrorhamnose reductase